MNSIKRNALLIGNGINCIDDNGYEWGNLLNEIITKYCHGKISYKEKPFPLLYEQIYCYGINKTFFNEMELKHFIRGKIKKIEENVVHKKLVSLGVNEIITTNYDYCLEKSLSVNQDSIENDSNLKENKYNVFRYNRIKNTRFWHIHGEANRPNSITLGYEHYSGYLQKLRDFIVTHPNEDYKQRINPYKVRIKSYEVVSWTDLMFWADVHMVGLALEYVEIDLWWLIDFRARQFGKQKTKSKDIVRNTIYYHYPKDLLNSKMKLKIEILESLKVKTVGHNHYKNDKIKYYDSVVNYIKRKIK